MGFSAPAPGTRAGTCVGSFALSQASQSGHQEPGCSVALASQPSRLALRGFGPVQYWYLCLSGGFTTPAICPEPDSTKRTGPPKYLLPSSTDFAGAIWSSRVARL